MFSAVLKKNESSWMAHAALAAGLVLAIAVSGWLGPFSAACASLRQDTLRLHVQANSNSEADQALKLLVRDAVLETAQTLFAGLPDQQAALETARAHLQDFQRAAERVELGDHAGRNWFCVLYPALCLSAAQPAEYPEAAQQEILENSQGYEVRFAALEAVERLEEWLHEN